MKIWEVDKLFLFLIFFIPGFISIKIFDLIVPSERRDFSKSLFEAIGYSSLNFALLSWLIILIHSGDFYLRNKIWYFLFLILILFIMPAIWPLLFRLLSTWPPLCRHIIHPLPKPWDFVFGNRRAYWVIVNLKDGRKIGGVYGPNSFSSSYPAEEQIYLEQVWKLDEKGRFLEPVERSEGIIILGSELSSIELFE